MGEHPRMSNMNDFYVQRGKKLGWLIIALATCLAVATLFLSGKPEWFAWGVVTGLAVTAATFLRGWYAKRPPRKRRWYKPGMVASFFMSIFGAILGSITNVVLPTSVGPSLAQ
jgi:hypothetical protein